VDDRLVESVAAKLAAISRRSGFERACGMGGVILCSFYDGDEACWSARAKGKLSSIRRLAQRLNGAVRATELHRSVHVSLICRAFPFVLVSEHITVSHVDAVIGLSRGHQEVLLRGAERDNLSVRDLRGLRRQLKSEAGERRGRPRSPALAKAVTRARAALGALEGAWLAIKGIDPQSGGHAELLGILGQVRARSEELAALVRGDRPSGVQLLATAVAKAEPPPGPLRNVS